MLSLATYVSAFPEDRSRKAERQYILLAPIMCSEFAVPRGFVTDLASIPRIAWPLIGPSGRHATAAIVHDWLYRADTGHTRREADRLFLQMMEAAEVPTLRRWILWAGVRLPVGWIIWKRNKRRTPKVLSL